VEVLEPSIKTEAGGHASREHTGHHGWDNTENVPTKRRDTTRVRSGTRADRQLNGEATRIPGYLSVSRRDG